MSSVRFYRHSTISSTLRSFVIWRLVIWKKSSDSSNEPTAFMFILQSEDEERITQISEVLVYIVLSHFSVLLLS